MNSLTQARGRRCQQLPLFVTVITRCCKIVTSTCPTSCNKRLQEAYGTFCTELLDVAGDDSAILEAPQRRVDPNFTGPLRCTRRTPYSSGYTRQDTSLSISRCVLLMLQMSESVALSLCLGFLAEAAVAALPAPGPTEVDATDPLVSL